MKKRILWVLAIITLYGCIGVASPNRNIQRDAFIEEIMGIYKPTKRECFDEKHNVFCMEKMTQFEFIKGRLFDINESDNISFIIWSPRMVRRGSNVNKYRLLPNNRSIVTSDKVLHKNKSIILEDYKDQSGQYFQKVEFLDKNHGIYISDYNHKKNIIHFKRIHKNEMKEYKRFYPKVAVDDNKSKVK